MSLDQLASELTGSLVLPGSDGFPDARNYHGRSGDPAAVVRVAGPADVAAAVAAARRTGLSVAVRGGGHSNWESVPGALVVDLGALREISVEATPSSPEGARLVHVGGGATWGEVAGVLGGYGLAISSGDTRSVGVGGLTLGAGIGWLVRLWGLTVDQLVGAEVVTAAGDVVEVSADSHPDLFWALRGGGGNFGVVTRFDFLARPLPGVVHATITLDGSDLAGSVRAFRDAMRSAPRALNGSLVRTPAMGPEMPSRTLIELAWAGTDEADGRAVFAPLTGLARAVSVEVAPAAYVDLLQEAPMPPPGMAMPTVVDENGWFESLDDDVVDAVIGAIDAAGEQMLLVRWLGGAFSDVDPDATAVAFRSAEAFIVTAGFVPPGADEGDAQRMQTALDPIATHALGAYGNFTNSIAPGLSQRMFPAPTLARLRAVKRTWDPDNVFTRNHNIEPA